MLNTGAVTGTIEVKTQAHGEDTNEQVNLCLPKELAEDLRLLGIIREASMQALITGALEEFVKSEMIKMLAMESVNQQVVPAILS